METDDAPRDVAGALDRVSQWRTEAENDCNRQIDDVDREVESLQKAVANLHQQLSALGDFRAELQEKLGALADEEIEKGFNAVFAALGDQSTALGDRAEKVSEAERSRRTALAEAMQDSTIAPLLEEYQAFKEKVEPGLTNLPDSYRGVLLAHHEGVVARLRDHMARAAGGVVDLGEDWLDFDVVLAIDEPEDDESAVLMLVVPVDESVHVAWASREEDLQTWVVARMVQALFGVLKGTPAEVSALNFGGCQGMLGVEVELGTDIAEDFPDRVKAAVEQIGEQAPELKAARLRLKASWVQPDYLFPPDEAEEADSGA